MVLELVYGATFGRVLRHLLSLKRLKAVLGPIWSKTNPKQPSIEMIIFPRGLTAIKLSATKSGRRLRCH